MKISTSKIEIRDLLKAWLVVSLAFAIVLSGGLNGLINANFLFMIIVSLIAVGTGFLLHELAHKITAQRYGCFAEFRSFDQMLLLALAMSFFGFVFAAPGAVMINGYVTRERNGKISLAGPLTNLFLALIFLSLYIIIDLALFRTITFYGFLINSWLGLFNLIPFGNFDGTKISRWSKKVYIPVLIFAIILVFISFSLIK